jgi:DNA polymerase III alpha subunit
MVDAEKFEAMKDQEAKATYTPFDNFIDYHKYYHLTMHFRNQHSLREGCRLLSFADERAEKHGSELKPLFSWKELEEMGSHRHSVLFSSCLIGMVQRHLAFGGRADIAEAYYKNLRSIVKPGNFFVEVFPTSATVTGTRPSSSPTRTVPTTRLPAYRSLKTDRRYDSKHGGMKAQESGRDVGDRQEGPRQRFVS